MSTRDPRPASSEEALRGLRELEATLRGMSTRQFRELVSRETLDNLERLSPATRVFEGQALVDVALWSVSFVIFVESVQETSPELRRVLATVLRRAAEVVEGGVDQLARGGN